MRGCVDYGSGEWPGELDSGQQADDGRGFFQIAAIACSAAIR